MGSKVRNNPMKQVGDVNQGDKEGEDELLIERYRLVQGLRFAQICLKKLFFTRGYIVHYIATSGGY
jgi:hypothetical protein